MINITHIKIETSEKRVGQLFSIKRLTLREKFLKKLFGEKRSYVVLVPNEKLEKISIIEKGDEDVKDKAIDGCKRRCRESCI